MIKISLNQAIKLIEDLNGRIFNADVIKKDGVLKNITCRTGVKKYGPGEMKYRPEDKGLISVFELSSQKYKMINLAGLRKIKAEGQEYSVIDN